jgi:tripartite-type tricarboxylate transporter receptor subunit TctC
MNTSRRFCIHAFAGCAAAASTMAGAQSTVAWPARPVTLIVAQAPGGPNDIEARMYAGKMSEVARHKFMVDYKPGAGTTIGAIHVARSAPDGYTLLAVTAGVTIFPALYPRLEIDVLKDFAPISLLSRKPQLLLVRPDFPANTFEEYIAYARANPGRINYATTGSGGGAHLIGAWMHSLTNTKVTFFPYKGTAPILVDMMGGRMDATAALIAVTMPLYKAGKVRVLAITSDKRSRLLPEVPTVAERGIPEYNYTTWMGFSAPRGTQPEIINRLNGWFVQVAKQPDIIQNLESDGSEAVGSTSAQFQQQIESEVVRWNRVVKEAGIKAED